MSDFDKKVVNDKNSDNDNIETASALQQTNISNRTEALKTPLKHQSLKDKSLIIFDWDGTLMDSIGLIIESMHVAGQAHGFTATDEDIKAIIGLSLEKGIEQVFHEASIAERSSILKSYADYYIPTSTQADQPHSQFFAGIEQMLQTLQSQGKQLAVATGKKRAGLDRVMDFAHSRHYFVSSRCADESGSKPDPQMLIEILEETNHSVDEAVFIGDSVHDIKMANALGMTSIAVSYGASSEAELQALSPTYQVDSPNGLIELLIG